MFQTVFSPPYRPQKDNYRKWSHTALLQYTLPQLYVITLHCCDLTSVANVASSPVWASAMLLLVMSSVVAQSRPEHLPCTFHRHTQSCSKADSCSGSDQFPHNALSATVPSLYSALTCYLLTDNPDLRHHRDTCSGQSVWIPDIPQCTAQAPPAVSRRFSRKLGNTNSYFCSVFLWIVQLHFLYLPPVFVPSWWELHAFSTLSYNETPRNLWSIQWFYYDMYHRLFSTHASNGGYG